MKYSLARICSGILAVWYQCKFVPSDQLRKTIGPCTWLKLVQCSRFGTVLQTLRERTIWAVTWQNEQNGCAPSEDLDQRSLIRVFAVRLKKAWVLSYPLSAQGRLWSDWADAQVDLCLRWTHTHFVGFVMPRLILLNHSECSSWNYAKWHRVIASGHTKFRESTRSYSE